MVTQLFPAGMKGLIIVVLIAALVSNIGSSLNSVSTVFTMDIFVKKYQPRATNKDIIRIGRWVTVGSAVLSVIIALAINSIKGLNLFDVFQSILGFLAPPMSVVFLFGILWKKTSAKAVNYVLTYGTAFSVLIGILYLWVLPARQYPAWPHFLLLSFYIFLILSALLFAVSLWSAGAANRKADGQQRMQIGFVHKRPSRLVILSWVVLSVVMIALYIYFNGH